VPETHEIDIEFLTTSGDGVGHLEERRQGVPGDRERQQVVVPYTIPGERVRVRLGPALSGGATATLEAVVRQSPHRISPRCRHFGPDAEPGVGPCGGCAWQHIAYPEQLRLKADLVTRLVRAAVPHAPAALPMLPGAVPDEPWGYRQKVHFVFGSSGLARPGGRLGNGRQPDALVMGHYVRGTRRVLPVRECPVHVGHGNAVAFQFRDEYIRAHVAAAPDGALKSLALRVGRASPEVMATLVVNGEDDKALRAATRRVLARADAPTSLHVNIHPRDDAFVFGPETRRIAGRDRLREQVGGVAFLISPDAFFQTNVHAAEILARLVADAIPAGARVLDLYAGSGLFALSLAQRGHQVIAVEENRSAVADGEASRRLNRIPDERCRFIARRAEDAVRAMGRSEDRRWRFDAVVLDPPREGCSPAVIEQLFDTIAPTMAVYVSCNPEALARDLAAIVGLRYRIRSLQPVDMFPHTAHVETVAVLTR
jgi:23S rRNA (uracil1939-C5)-methyltransferase